MEEYKEAVSGFPKLEIKEAKTWVSKQQKSFNAPIRQSIKELKDYMADHPNIF